MIKNKEIILFPLLCSVCLFGCSNMINVASLISDIPKGDSDKPRLVIDKDSLGWDFDNNNTPSDTTDDTYTAEWGAATGGTVKSYTVNLYYWGNQIDSEAVSPPHTSIDFTSAMKTNGVFNDGTYYFTVQALSDDPATIGNSDVMTSPDQAIGGMYVNNDGFSSSSFPAAGDLTITRSDGGATTGKGSAANPHKLSFFAGDSLTITVTGLSGTVGAVSWTVNGASVGTANSPTYTFRAEDWNQGTYTIAVHATISGVAYSAMTVAEVDL